jgi:hypothetical protein
MDIGSFLLLAIGLGIFGILLAIALVVSIVSFSGWLIKLFSR